MFHYESGWMGLKQVVILITVNNVIDIFICQWRSVGLSSV